MFRRMLLTLVAIAGVLAATEPQPLVRAVDSVAMTVSDLDRSVEFYTQVLSFEKVSEQEMAGEAYERLFGVFGSRIRSARLRLGGESLELMEYLAPPGRAAPADARSNDLWFQHVAVIVSDMDRAYAHLRRHNVRHVSPGPQRLPDWNRNAGGIRAFYFRDPDGHPLEILQFPAGKGDPKWQRRSERLFLGIDHTAIVVSNTEASLHFYRDTLGLRVAGESENYGPEQERLNNVFGARLRITSVRADSGPGIEFLEYLAPLDGRAYPRDARPNDLIHWHTRLLGSSAGSSRETLQSFRSALISSGVITLPDSSAAYRKSLLVRDPDGHAVQIVE